MFIVVFCGPYSFRNLVYSVFFVFGRFNMIKRVVLYLFLSHLPRAPCFAWAQGGGEGGGGGRVGVGGGGLFFFPRNYGL